VPSAFRSPYEPTPGSGRGESGTLALCPHGALNKWDEFLTAAIGGFGGGLKLTIDSPDPSSPHDLGGGLPVSATVSGNPTTIRATLGFRDKDGKITTISDREVRSPDAQ
jgi:hypothetical protein